MKRLYPRLFGVVLIAFLLWRADAREVVSGVRQASWLMAVAAVLNLPQIGIKVVRWRVLLGSQGIAYPLSSASLAYFSSIFAGLLTPGRLGELVKAFHVRKDCGVPLGTAFASVLLDRVFDLYALLLMAGAGALYSSQDVLGAGWAVVVILVTLTIPLAAFIYEPSFLKLKGLALAVDSRVAKHLWRGGLLIDLRNGLRMMGWRTVIKASAMTGAAYVLFFGQSFLVARSIELPLTFVQVAFAVAIGSLVTLMPLSISGVGTRDAAIVVYLGLLGIAAEPALSFSLLFFLTFYIGGGLMGAVAWLLKPAPLTDGSREKELSA